MRVEGRWTDRRVTIDGRALSPKRSQRCWNHSPDGFAWGFAGSGPAQLALAILLKGGVPPRRAVALHQRFKFETIAPLPQGDFSIEIDLDAWLAAQTPEVDA